MSGCRASGQAVRPRICNLAAMLSLCAGISTALGPCVALAQMLPEGVGVDQQPGTQLPLELEFQNSEAQHVRLGDFFRGRPVLVIPVYYRCPMLCGLELNALVRCLRAMRMTPGNKFEIVAFSIAPGETPKLAKEKKTHYLDAYGRESARSGWHFLTGSHESIDRLCDAIGFRAKLDPRTGEYAHAACSIVCTPDGRIARYLLGIDYRPRDLRLALVEASQNTIGSVSDQVLLFCFMYDPATGKYGLAIQRLIRAAGILTVIAIAAGVGWMLWRERQGRDEPSRNPPPENSHPAAQPISN